MTKVVRKQVVTTFEDSKQVAQRNLDDIEGNVKSIKEAHDAQMSSLAESKRRIEEQLESMRPETFTVRRLKKADVIKVNGEKVEVEAGRVVLTGEKGDQFAVSPEEFARDFEEREE